MDSQNKQIPIQPEKPRQGWEESFRVMSENGDDRLLDEYTVTRTRFDEKEWEWE